MYNIRDIYLFIIILLSVIHYYVRVLLVLYFSRCVVVRIHSFAPCCSFIIYIRRHPERAVIGKDGRKKKEKK